VNGRQPRPQEVKSSVRASSTTIHFSCQAWKNEKQIRKPFKEDEILKEKATAVQSCKWGEILLPNPNFI